MGIRQTAKLAFSSWVAPNYQLEDILALGREFLYEGFEPVFEQDHAHELDLSLSEEAVSETRKQFEDMGLPICCLATPLAFAGLDEAARTAGVERLKQYVALADRIGARFIRVFGGQLPGGVEPMAAVNWTCDALAEAVEEAEKYPSGITICLETQGDFANTTLAREIIRQIYSERIGIVWNLAQPIRRLETLEQAFDNISDRVRHVHIVDMAYSEDATEAANCKFGQGFVPIRRSIEYLATEGFKGFLSVEVVEGGEAEEILPDYGEGLRAILEQVDPEPVETQ